MAVEKAHLKVVERLLKAKADVNGDAALMGGLTALEATKKNGAETMLKLLKSALIKHL